MQKMRPLDDKVYNWIADYLCNGTHCTKVHGVISPPLPINASIVQGSAIGPVAFILNASDLRASKQGNKLHKYADDTYLIVPSNNSDTITWEMDHIASWASENNLRLNPAKAIEMIVKRGRSACQTPPPLLGITRVRQMEILGVTIQDSLSMEVHTKTLVGNTSKNLYALKILKAHGLPTTSLYTAHNLRRRTHNRILPTKTVSTERNFFIRMLYS